MKTQFQLIKNNSVKIELFINCEKNIVTLAINDIKKKEKFHSLTEPILWLSSKMFKMESAVLMELFEEEKLKKQESK